MAAAGRARHRPSGGGISLFSQDGIQRNEDTDYTIIIEKGDGNYSACCPDLPGVVAAAETEEETAELMKSYRIPPGRLKRRKFETLQSELMTTIS